MSGGLFALLDDIAALVKLAAASLDDVAAAAAKASAKAAGVVIDDAAVTPRYVSGLAASRELPIIKNIAIGSLRNKLLFILPAAMLLSQFAHFLLTPLLMIGGTYLCFEGAEKIWGRIAGHSKPEAKDAVDKDPDHERRVTSSAIRTDFILSTEIMVIALNEVMDQNFWARLAILAVVAVGITAGVYGVVALIVKMDDIGLSLSQRASTIAQKVGRGLVVAMPKVLGALSVIGVAAMLWVGGHIILVGIKDLGWTPMYELVHSWEIAAGGGFLGWLVNMLASALLGLVVGAFAVAVMHVLPFGKGHGAESSHSGSVTTSGEEAPSTVVGDARSANGEARPRDGEGERQSDGEGQERHDGST